MASDFSLIQLNDMNTVLSMPRDKNEQEYITVNIFLSDQFEFKMLKMQRCDLKNINFPKSVTQLSEKGGIHLYDCFDSFVKCEKLG